MLVMNNAYWGCFNQETKRWMLNKNGEVSYFPSKEIAEAQIGSLKFDSSYIPMIFSGLETKVIN
jgi:hypothetical protein